MEYDRDRVDEMVLALLYLTSSRDQYATRAWKGLDSQVLDRLHSKGYIGDPRTKGASVLVTEAGARLSKELFFKHFSGASHVGPSDAPEDPPGPLPDDKR